MSKKTKKVKSTGRFGTRYGRGIKLRVLKMEEKQKQEHKCPKCSFAGVKRLAAGVYYCPKCNNKFAGGAYTPTTMSGEIVSKMITQKKFFPHIKELTEIKEGIAVEETVPEKKEVVEEEGKEEKAKKPEKKEEKKESVKKQKKEEAKEKKVGKEEENEKREEKKEKTGEKKESK